MGRICHEFRHDIRTMGFAFYVPIAIDIAFILIIYAMSTNDNIYGPTYAIQLMEAFLPLIGGVWSVFMLRDLLEKSGGELYFSFCRRSIYWGLYRLARLAVLYGVLVTVTCQLVGLWLKVNFFPTLWLLYLTQGLFFMGLGFMVMNLYPNVGVALAIMVLYFCIQFASTGILYRYTSYTNVYVKDQMLRLSVTIGKNSIFPYMMRALTMGALFTIVGQIRLCQRRFFIFPTL